MWVINILCLRSFSINFGVFYGTSEHRSCILFQLTCRLTWHGSKKFTVRLEPYLKAPGNSAISPCEETVCCVRIICIHISRVLALGACARHAQRCSLLKTEKTIDWASAQTSGVHSAWGQSMFISKQLDQCLAITWLLLTRWSVPKWNDGHAEENRVCLPSVWDSLSEVFSNALIAALLAVQEILCIFLRRFYVPLSWARVVFSVSTIIFLYISQI